MITTHEEPEARPAVMPDIISLAVGATHYVQNHRTGLQISSDLGRSPRLAVSRYYWDLESPVAIDFVRDLRFGEAEVATKLAHFRQQGVHYIVVKDQFDGERAEQKLAELRAAAARKSPTRRAKRPVTGPRRRRS